MLGRPPQVADNLASQGCDYAPGRRRPVGTIQSRDVAGHHLGRTTAAHLVDERRTIEEPAAAPKPGILVVLRMIDSLEPRNAPRGPARHSQHRSAPSSASEREVRRRHANASARVAALRFYVVGAYRFVQGARQGHRPLSSVGLGRDGHRVHRRAGAIHEGATIAARPRPAARGSDGRMAAGAGQLGIAISGAAIRRRSRWPLQRLLSRFAGEVGKADVADPPGSARTRAACGAIVHPFSSIMT